MLPGIVVPIRVKGGNGYSSRTTSNIKYHCRELPAENLAKRNYRCSVYEGSPETVLEVSDAYLVPGSKCLYDRNGTRIAESCIRRGERLDEFVASEAINISLPSDYTVVEEPILYLSWLPKNWGHFLTEGTSRLWAIFQYPELRAMNGLYLMSRPVHKNIEDFVRALSLNIHTMEYRTSKQTKALKAIKFRTVIVPAPSFFNRGAAYSIHQKFASSVIDYYLRDNQSELSDRPVFLSRAKFGGTHCVQNQVELEEAIARLQFLIVHPEELTLMEQVNLFNRYRHFTGCWGSAFHTSILSRSPNKLATHVLCEGIPNVNYLMLDSILGTEANYVESMIRIPGPGQPLRRVNLYADVNAIVSYYRESGLYCV
jgi:hypothetical protein